jgi:hypothetical protein
MTRHDDNVKMGMPSRRAPADDLEPGHVSDKAFLDPSPRTVTVKRGLRGLDPSHKVREPIMNAVARRQRHHLNGISAFSRPL